MMKKINRIEVLTEDDIKLLNMLRGVEEDG